MQLSSKVVVITGAARGLGRAYAVAMASEGASVLACDINECSETVAEVRAAGGRIESAVTDVSDMKSCQAMADAAVAAFGKIDVLVNNAALYATLKGGRFETLDEAQWDAVMNVNVKGTWQCCKAVVNPMREAGGGSIINISSRAGVYGSPYTPARTMARELGKDSIRVNAVAPSAVMTEATEEFFGEKFEKAKLVIASGQAIQRNLETTDLTGTVIYLASDASIFVTGQTHMVDGGSWFL